jgi:hypothetical protein
VTVPSPLAPVRARIEVRDGRTFWRCPACGRTLGEVAEGMLVIKVQDRRIVVPIGPSEQACPCGLRSGLHADMLES